MVDRPAHDDERCGTPEYGTCFKCHIGSVRLGKPSDFPTRTYSHHAPPRGGGNEWEKGVAYSYRNGGQRVPYLNREGSPMPIKEFHRQKHLIEENRRRLAQPAT